MSLPKIISSSLNFESHSLGADLGVPLLNFAQLLDTGFGVLTKSVIRSQALFRRLGWPRRCK